MTASESNVPDDKSGKVSGRMTLSKPAHTSASSSTSSGASSTPSSSFSSSSSSSRLKSGSPAQKKLSIVGCIAVLPFAVAHAAFLLWTWQWAQGKTDPFAACSIAVPAVATLSYLALVRLGPAAMDYFSVRTFELNEAMFMYNVYQTFVNAAIVGLFLYAYVAQGLPIWGIGVDRSPAGVVVAFGIYMHYNNKFVEYLDTVFMVLRRKNEQLSFLHWYHHLLMGWAWFAVIKIACGGDALWGALANSFIHVVMYSYYALRAVGIQCAWKRHVTNLQMIQFVACMAHSIYLLLRPDSNEIYPPALSFLEMFVMVNMLILFSQFYIKQYLRKPSRAAKKLD